MFLRARLSFQQALLSPVFSLGSDYFTLSDETTESRPSRKMSPCSCGCSNSGIAAYPVLNVEKRFIRSLLLDGHEANPGRGSSRRSDKSRPGVGAVLRNEVRHPRRTWSPADSVHQLALGRTRQESRIPQQEFGQRTDPSDPCLWPRGPRLSVTDSIILGRRGPCQEEGRSNLRQPLEEAGRQRLRRQHSRRSRTIIGRQG